MGLRSGGTESGQFQQFELHKQTDVPNRATGTNEMHIFQIILSLSFFPVFDLKNCKIVHFVGSSCIIISQCTVQKA